MSKEFPPLIPRFCTESTASLPGVADASPVIVREVLIVPFPRLSIENDGSQDNV